MLNSFQKQRVFLPKQGAVAIGFGPQGAPNHSEVPMFLGVAQDIGTNHGSEVLGGQQC